MADPWQAGETYEIFMGRWSRLVARRFLDWPGGEAANRRWLDVGCGTGALSELIAQYYSVGNPGLACLLPAVLGWVK